MVDQHIGTDRRVADAEGADHVLLQPPLGERLARVLAALDLPEMGLEELAGIGHELPDPASGDPASLDVLRHCDGEMLPDPLKRRVMTV